MNNPVVRMFCWKEWIACKGKINTYNLYACTILQVLCFNYICFLQPQWTLKEESRCFKKGEAVAATYNNSIEYSLKTCCQGLKFAIEMYRNDTAMTIKCVQRWSLISTSSLCYKLSPSAFIHQSRVLILHLDVFC